ncbi:exported hypothetical protein [Azospirillaceae bacterium]
MTAKTEKKNVMSRDRNKLFGAASALVMAVALATTIGATPASAAPAAAAKAKESGPCYTQAEYEAEQGLRLDTELMVAGLQCNDAYADRKTFQKYGDFNKRHSTLVRTWEQAMIGFFQRTGGNATKRFDTYRTELANAASRRGATMTASIYCHTTIDDVTGIDAASADDVRKLLVHPRLLHISTRPICGTQVSSPPEPVYAPASSKPSKSSKPAAKPSKNKKKK